MVFPSAAPDTLRPAAINRTAFSKSDYTTCPQNRHFRRRRAVPVRHPRRQQGHVGRPRTDWRHLLPRFGIQRRGVTALRPSPSAVPCEIQKRVQHPLAYRLTILATAALHRSSIYSSASPSRIGERALRKS